jgi:uncharacterized protein YbbK (DUF523 family)
MGIPRPAIRIVESPAGQRLLAPLDRRGLHRAHARLLGGEDGRAPELGLDGYVLKKNSPSCGMERISVYRG